MSDLSDMIDLSMRVAGGVATVLATVLALGHRALKRSMVPREEFDIFRSRHAEQVHALEVRLQEGDVRFARLQTAIEHLPTKEDVQSLARQLEGLSGDSKGMAERVNTVFEILRRIETPLNLLVQHHIVKEGA